MRHGVDADVAIIGAGLGGLCTGIRLRQQGLSVIMLERLARVGGLCGTVMDGDVEQVIACNDFGRGIKSDLLKLGVDFPFEPTGTRVVRGNRSYLLPPDWKTILRLVPHAVVIARHLLGQHALRRGGKADSEWLQSHLERLNIGGEAADLLMLPAYLMGVSPDRFRMDFLDHEFRFRYGYTRPLTPIGGPQKLADALRKRFTDMGGVLWLDTEWEGGSRQPDGVLCLRTSEGDMRVRKLVSTLVQPESSDDVSVNGLPISMLWLRLDAGFPLPAGIHTHVHYPPGIAQWFGDIYRGVQPARFGFHFFSSDLEVRNGERGASVYFYAPLDRAEDMSVQRSMEEYIMNHLDALVPGLRGAIRGVRHVSPADFHARHRVMPRVMPRILPAGKSHPANYRKDLDMYFAGASSWPPGDHAGSAIRSAFHVSHLVEQGRDQPRQEFLIREP